jgi:hypothetical protein
MRCDADDRDTPGGSEGFEGVDRVGRLHGAAGDGKGRRAANGSAALWVIGPGEATWLHRFVAAPTHAGTCT